MSLQSALKTRCRTAIVDTASADGLRGAFREAMARLPGLLPHHLPELVVVKPNLCDNAAWETGVTTDPTWVIVLAEELRRRRPDIKIQVVESDAISAYRAFRSCDESFDRLGYRDAADEAKVELVNLSKSDSWEVAVPTLPKPLRIPDLFLRDFYFISVANVKLHPYERFTGIMKNNYGLLPQQDRTELHVWLPQVLFTLYELCRTDLAILDGRIALEGKGPIIGRPKTLNRLIVGSDALAVDQTACRLIGLKPADVPHLRYIARRTKRRPSEVDVIGDTTPVPLEVDNPETSSLIIRKFAIRRFHHDLEQLSLRATGLAGDARRHPVQFLGRVMRKVFRGNR